MNECDEKRDVLIGLSLIAVGRAWRRLFLQIIAEQGLGDVPVLPLSLLLQGGDGIRQNELAKRLGVESTAVVRVLDNLERDGLVSRAADHSDRRAKLIYLTEQGRELARRIVKAREDLRVELLKDVPMEDILVAQRFLDQVETALTAKLREQKA